MAPLNMSYQHGQSWDDARTNFENGINKAQARFGKYLKTIEWSPDRTAARITGSGFDVNLSLDPDAVHAKGKIPFFASFFEAPVKKFLEETFPKHKGF